MLMCEYAMRKGLRAIAFTDHCEVNAYNEEHYDRTIRQSYFEALKARAVFRGKMIVSVGIEIGQPLSDIALSEKIASELYYDIVLASIHNLQDMQDFFFLDYTQQDVDALLTAYFEEMLKMVEWGGFDVLAHLTYPLRYICGDHGIKVDLHQYAQAIDAILSALAQREKALEINTSGLRQPLGDCMPPFALIKRFKELGGRYITVGSDAHRAHDVGAKLEEGMRLAMEAGFSHLTLFESRMPVEIPII